MTYSIVFKHSVSRDLRKIDKSKLKSLLDKIEVELSENPKNPKKHPLLKGKFEGLRKFRIGDYRVIYTVIEDSVLVLRISHRKDAYK